MNGLEYIYMNLNVHINYIKNMEKKDSVPTFTLYFLFL